MIYVRNPVPAKKPDKHCLFHKENCEKIHSRLPRAKKETEILAGLVARLGLQDRTVPQQLRTTGLYNDD